MSSFRSLEMSGFKCWTSNPSKGSCCQLYSQLYVQYVMSLALNILSQFLIQCWFNWCSLHAVICKSKHSLTASIPDNCIPMLMTTTEKTCQRTVGSSSSCQTDTVSTVNRERCSSCISSISA